jgi:hypothetical protein
VPDAARIQRGSLTRCLERTMKRGAEQNMERALYSILNFIVLLNLAQLCFWRLARASTRATAHLLPARGLSLRALLNAALAAASERVRPHMHLGCFAQVPSPSAEQNMKRASRAPAQSPHSTVGLSPCLPPSRAQSPHSTRSAQRAHAITARA